MIRRLLLKNLSISQLLCYALASFAGLAVVGCALKFYADLSPALSPSEGESALFSGSYMVLSKPVSMLNTFGEPAAFTPEEIAELKAQPWADGAAGFVAANFSVTARVDFAGRGFATHMFLEAIPDEFIDVRPEGWDWTPGSDGCLPVIISKDYLALYNFGFAAARGLPQVTPEMLSQVPLSLTLGTGPGSVTVCARIAGFSSRLNTIAVPMRFMEEANRLLAPGADTRPSRLIVRLRDSADPAIDAFLSDRGYERAGEDSGASRAASVLRAVTAVVIGVGAVISVLALVILLLSVGLLIRKNSATVATLLFLGYTPRAVSRSYILLTAAVNAAVTALASVTVVFASRAWCALLGPLGVAPASPWPAIALLCAVMAVLTAVNALTVSRNIRRIFDGKS